MAYNKSKYVEAAQKLLNQGKVAQAIAEYQHILKFEPRDQVTLMTVGELYIRQGETFQAIDYFERLAQIFVGDGFLTKAIAVYKRIAKLAPEEIRPLEKLADLYVQQGVMSEARPLFLQLAEIHLKHNRQPEAVNLLKKLLVAEPDNLRIQIRLADLYRAMGQQKEATETYVSAAQRALARGDQSESEKLADKALKLDPNFLPATIVKARSLSARGNIPQAAELLEHVPGLEKGGEQAEFLLDLYLRSLNWEKATSLAFRIFEADEKNFGLTQKVAEAMLQSGQGEKAMAIVDRMRIPMLDAGEHEAVGRMLNDLVAKMPGRIEPHEWLVDSYARTSDSFRLPDALAQLGDALVANGQLERAKEVFEQLVDREPESDSAKRKLNGVLQKLGIDAPDVPPAPVVHADLSTELKQAEAPKVRPDLESPTTAALSSTEAEHRDAASSLDEETQKFISQSLTDVDLFASYGLTQKAIGLLEAILRRAPRHTPTLEKLLDFVLGAGDDRRTAELAARLEKIHTDRGDERSAERFAELRRRFQRASGITDEQLAAETAAALGGAPGGSVSAADASEAVVVDEEIPTFEVASEAPQAAAPSAPAPVPVSAAPNPQDVHEVDLSDEWLSVLEDDPAPADPAAQQPVASAPHAETRVADSAPAVPEFEISVEPAAVEETPAPAAESAFVPPAEMPAYAEFQVPAQADAATDSPPAANHEAQPEIPAAAPVSGSTEAAPVAEQVAPEAPAESQPVDHAPEPQPEPVESAALPVEVPAEQPAFAATQDQDQDYDLILEPDTAVSSNGQHHDVPADVQRAEPVHATQTSASAPPANGMASDRFLADLASEIEELGMGQLTPSYSTPDSEAPAKAVNTFNQSDAGPLKDVFDDFRAELGEMGAEDEDLETHYNLGTAFREMGLLEEAISEFQKVAKANERGRPFRYAMQCCTLLGLAFMEKGQPDIAAIWYERALLTPGVDPESILALRYDLGIAQESAGEPEAALKSFSKVYAMNIDYRDVAERIAALQKPSR
ncbi:MAG TPA: tetratricopeptide repeat protein [Candidatus Acidoferrum sp.]